MKNVVENQTKNSSLCPETSTKNASQVLHLLKILLHL